MPVGAIIGGLAIAGGSIASGIIGSNAAEDAAKTQAQSAQNALDFQKQVFNQSQSNYDQAQSKLAPFITAGTGATGLLSNLTGAGGKVPDFSSFYNSPDYQFALQQGTRGVTNYENAQGMGLSGGALKDIASFNQGLASQQYGNYFSRLMQIATLGGNAASGSLNNSVGFANSNANMSNTIGNTTMGVGQAQASGIVGSANATTGAISSGIQNSILASALGGKGASAYGGNSLASFLNGNPFNSMFGGGSPSGYGAG